MVVYEVDGACGVEPLVFGKEEEPDVQSFHCHETKNVMACFPLFASVKYRIFQITKCRSDGPALAFPGNEGAQEGAVSSGLPMSKRVSCLMESHNAVLR